LAWVAAPGEMKAQCYQEVCYLDEKWVVKDAEKHQDVGNPYSAPAVGDTDDGKLELKVV